jgi:hypothetical protein
MTRKQGMQLRFTAAQHEWLRRQAEGRETSIADVVRDLVREAMSRERTSPPPAQPAPTIPDDERVEF